MNIRVVRFVFGITVLLAHFGAIGCYFILGRRYFTEFTDILQGVLTVAPVAALYTTIFVKYVTTAINILEDEKSETVSVESFSVQYLIILVFSAALVLGPIYLFIDGSRDFQNIKLYTGAVDTIFGVYMAIIFDRLFPRKIYE